MIKEINGDNFARRMVGMMVDYDITMFDALLWDFEAYNNADKIYESHGAKTLERKFKRWLMGNGIRDAKDMDFYTGVFMGTGSNFELKCDRGD